jgi:L-prolyl-PCP dehydrogenase
MSIDFAWSKEQLAFKKKVIVFAQEYLNHNLIEKDRAGVFDREVWDKCAEFGLLGLPIPQTYGGSGFDPLTTMLALEGLGYGCKDNGLVFTINNHIWSCAITILHHGTEAQKQAYLPRMCRGELIGGQVLTEPTSGSDAFNMRTTADYSEGHYLLNGTKTFITNAPIGAVFIVFARTNLNAGTQEAITAFIVDRQLPGFKISKVWEKSGLRTAQMGEIVFDHCRVPECNRLGMEGDGYKIFQATIEWERGFFFGSQVGSMERILDQCVAYAQERKQFGQAISSFQSVSNKIAEMKIRLELAKLIIYKIGWLKKENRIAFLESSIAKVFISEGLVQTCLDAIQIHGARGYMVEYELERELRDALAGTIYAGTSEINRSIISNLLSL